MSDLDKFHAQLLSISTRNLVQTSFSELEEITGLSLLNIISKINSLVKTGLIDSFFNTQVYDKNDNRLFIGLLSPEFIDALVKSGDKK